MNNELVMVILVAVLALSEALAYIPSVKSNGVFQMVVGVVKSLAGRTK